MKKFLILFIATISMSVFVGCDSDDEFTPPNFITFADVTTLTNQRAVSVNSTSSETFDLKVYTNNVTNSDRTFNVTVGATSTLSAAAYTLPGTVTIPANSNEGIVTINITGSGISNAGDILMLQLEDENGYVGGPLRLNVIKICDFDVAGEYMLTVGTAAPKPVTIVAGAAANQYIAKDLYAVGKDINFTVNPTTFAITLPTQSGFTHSLYGPANVTGLAGSKLEPCIRTITLEIRVNVAAGAFAPRFDKLVKAAE